MMSWVYSLLESLVSLGPLPVLLVGAIRPVSSDDEPQLSDLDLVRAVRTGDKAAYRGLVERYQNRIYHVVYGNIRDQEDARDITQDAFETAFRKLDSFQENSKFYTWLYRIAMNLTIDFTRRRTRAPVSAGAEEDVAMRESTRGIKSPSSGASPDGTLERNQLRDAILGALDRLPESHRQVFTLREIEGLSYKEIAEILDIAEGTVMSRLFYARRRMQESLVAYKDQA